MDPNETLARIRALYDIATNETDDNELAAELADAIEDLDYWLTTGGFLPDAWQRPAVAVTVTLDDQARRAIAHHWQQPTPATDSDVRDWITEMVDDLIVEYLANYREDHA